MLAKKYYFQYETIRAVKAVQYDSKRVPKPYVCKEEVEYPVWNIEFMIEMIGRLKHRLKTELMENEVEVIEGNEEVIRLMNSMTAEVFKELKLCVVGEEGYKESFYFDAEKGDCMFDLTSIRKMNHIGQHHYKIQYLQYKDKEVDLAKLCPEYWCGKWTMIRNSL